MRNIPLSRSARLMVLPVAKKRASDTGGVPRWKSSCPDRLTEATYPNILFQVSYDRADVHCTNRTVVVFIYSEYVRKKETTKTSTGHVRAAENVFLLQPTIVVTGVLTVVFTVSGRISATVQY